ncbi:MAG: hypothetical protein GF315_10860 [candidate division Zixibacteria bacterium]|nr:hypothetical protein [candidate division Zixibacteria bacterium]
MAEANGKRFHTRHLIFLLMAIAVVLPLIFKPGLPLRVTKEVQDIYDYIEGLPEESVVIISFDHEASSLPEMVPMAEALLRHCFRKNLKVCGMALLAEGTSVGDANLRRIGAEYNKEYGEDYIFWGFRPQHEVAILALGEDITREFKTDYTGRPISGFPIMQGLRNYQNVAAVISVGDGDIPIYWVNYAQARYGVNIIPAITAVMATTMYPFLQSEQIVGLAAGLKGAAEYEKLLNRTGLATRGMDAQSTAHVLIIVLIAIGNIIMFRQRGGKRS